jgi:hypothetical protein
MIPKMGRVGSGLPWEWGFATPVLMKPHDYLKSSA